jgi:hypothetical protein
VYDRSIFFRHPERSEGSRAQRVRQPQERPARFFATAAFAQNDTRKSARKKEMATMHAFSLIRRTLTYRRLRPPASSPVK